MKPRLLPLLLAAGLSTIAMSVASAPSALPATTASSLESTRQRLEKLAEGLHYFETGNIISNRDPSSVGPQKVFSGVGRYDQNWSESLALEHAQMLAALRAVGGERTALGDLLKHPDPKVRTLALGALFLREDAHDLPLIASLAEDTAASWPVFDQREPRRPETEFVVTPVAQVVGDVALAMLLSYLDAAYVVAPATGLVRGLGDRDTARPTDVLAAFAPYWAARGARDRSVSWFLVRMKRATRQTSPLRPQYQADIQRVLAEIDTLPPVERAWTLLYVRQGVFLSDSGNLVSDSALVAALKPIGPEALVQFLQHKSVMDDPDLRFDASLNNPRNQPFRGMAEIVLQHARELLRPEDADAVLAEANDEAVKYSGSPVKWVAAAAELKAMLDPTQAGDFLRAALRTYPNGRDQDILMGALWRIHGVAETKFLVDWYYTTDGASLGRDDFLDAVEAAKRSDTKGLLTALVADGRFERTKSMMLGKWLTIANAGQPTPLVAYSDVYDFTLDSNQPDKAATLAARLNLLRRYYGVPEKLATPPPAR